MQLLNYNLYICISRVVATNKDFNKSRKDKDDDLLTCGFFILNYMKTLFDNLKEEHKLQLKEMAILYPTAYAALVKALEENYLYSLLTISEAYSLVMNTSNKSFNIINLSELFYE